jgi:hypothetical protein
MALTKCTVTKGTIGDLGTTVEERGLTEQQFKDKFDYEPDGTIDYINDTLTVEIDAALALKATELMSYTTISTNTTLALAHKSKTLLCSAAANLTVPPNSSVAFDIGTMITIVRTGSGTVAVVAGSGVTINSKDSNLEIDGQYAAATLMKTATDTWALFGALT